ncbi:MAG: helix-turn-helix transcriptional regulator [Eubacteriales bacterium]|nr:helix-turn-helix transcriptional regulator [Eubacteriales bacterium]
MNIDAIGVNVAKLRKEKGVTQEELAQYVSVSAQAVSKWENGGVPDTELLPKIADFFGVSIDTLFGRSITDYSDLHTALAKKITESAVDQRFKTVMELCWTMERAMFGEQPKGGDLMSLQEELGEKHLSYSSVRSDYGITLMGLSRRLPYFLISPESSDKELAFFEGVDYVSFFKDFSDKTVFDTMVMLNKRENGKAFTPNLLMKNLNVGFEEAMTILKTLYKYGVIKTTNIEMDDVTQEVYTFDPTPSFVALLIFTREMLDRNKCYNYYMGGRNKPYLL